MYNTNGIRDCRQFPESSQQRKVSQTDRCRTKNALDVWKHTCVRLHFLPWSKSNLKAEIEWQMKHWTIVSDLHHYTGI